MELEYAGFWRRFGAYWLDVIVLIPLSLIAFWGNAHFRLFQIYYFIPGLIIGLWFHVYLVQRYGGTPGKLLLKIKISKIDGSNVGYKEAALRYSVLFLISTLLAISFIPTILEMSDTIYFSMDWKSRSQFMIDHAPKWYNYLHIAMQVWIWSEFIVMLTNKKKRAVHDFIASTVVIRNS